MTLTEILLGFGLTIVTAIPLGLLIALSPLAEAARLSADHADAARAEDRGRAAVPRLARLRHRIEGAADGADDVLPAAPREHQRIPDPRRPAAVPDEVDGRDALADVPLPALSRRRCRSSSPGIKTSATIAATAAIVAEFVGANKGLGYVLLRGTSTMDIELVFAVLVVLTVIGIAINYIVEFCEWAMTPWQRAKNS